MKTPPAPGAALRFAPFVCCHCHRPTRMSPAFNPGDRSRIFPSMCGDCAPDVPWFDFPAGDLAPEMVRAASVADPQSLATAEAQAAYLLICRVRGLVPYPERLS